MRYLVRLVRRAAVRVLELTDHHVLSDQEIHAIAHASSPQQVKAAVILLDQRRQAWGDDPQIARGLLGLSSAVAGIVGNITRDALHARSQESRHAVH